MRLIWPDLDPTSPSYGRSLKTARRGLWGGVVVGLVGAFGAFLLVRGWWLAGLPMILWAAVALERLDRAVAR